jgi:dTDP-4-amino-4,6-dideoxygalactose transaminase
MMVFTRSKLVSNAKYPYDSPFPVLNYRMTELQAALGIEQLKKVPYIVQRRRKLYRELSKQIDRLKSIRLSKPTQGSTPTPWFPFFHLDFKNLSASLDEYAKALNGEGILCSGGYTRTPMYNYEFVRKRFGNERNGKTSPVSCPAAELVLKRIVRLWGNDLHERCTKREVDDVSRAFEKLEKRYSSKAG